MSEEFTHLSGRLEKLLDVFISQHARYDECIFISDNVTYHEVYQILANKGCETLTYRFSVVTYCKEEYIQEFFNNLYTAGYHLHKRILVLLHTKRPIKSHNMIIII